MHELTFAERLIHATVKLTGFRNNIAINAGTGFMFNFAVEGDRSIPAIVTNRHVVEECDFTRATVHCASEGGPTGQFVTLDFIKGDEPAFFHPDPTVDLCALPLADLMNQAIAAKTPIFTQFIDFSCVPEDDEWRNFDAIEEVTMIGCPNGLIDEIHNLGIVRRGITATSLAKDFNGKKEFMIDMACFPGSSGSPVFLHNPTGYFCRTNNSYMMGSSRFKLVGILYSGPQAFNQAVKRMALEDDMGVFSMIHLGTVIKSSELKALDILLKSKLSLP